MPAQVIPYRRWRHTSGATASILGACPWHGEADRADWRIETCGYTIRHPDGTTGIGRPPFASEAEARAWIEAHG